MAKGLGGLINVGQETKKQALGGLLDAARAETQKDIAQEGLDQQRKIAEQQTAGTLTAVGAAVGGGAVGKGIEIGSTVGPAGAAVGAAIGFLVSKLFG